jgi:hypothetical protein
VLVGQGEQAVGGAGVDHGRGGLDHAAGDQADRLLGQGPAPLLEGMAGWRTRSRLDILPALTAEILGSAQVTLPSGSRIRLNGLATRR